MVVIFTGNSEIDQMLEEQIKNSIVVSYAEFIIEDEKFKNQTVILAAQAIEKEKIIEYLFELRRLNIRVILLIKNQNQLEVKEAMSMGIYDFVFGNFYTRDIQKLVEKPNTFADIALIYKKQFDIKCKIGKKGRK